MHQDPRPKLAANLHRFEAAVARRLRQWRHDDLSARLLAADPTLWSQHDTPELGSRLGWLDLPLCADSYLDEIKRFAVAARDAGLNHAVLLGMGGSSLAAEMFAAALPAGGGGTLEILDSIHPRVVAEAAARLDPERTLFLVASKSGRTIETLSLFRYFRDWLADAGRQPGEQLVAITDPGSGLVEQATESGFRKVWTADPEVGGRYSALTEFGLVPAALAGVDVDDVVARARRARELLEGSMEERIELLRMGAILGELGLAGTDKVTLLTGRGMVAFPAWLEQLIAESLGKRGRGLVPVAGEPLASARAYESDRLFVALEIEGERNGALAEALEELESVHPVVRIRLPEIADIGYELFRWQVAVAAAAAVLGVHPFDQPDVEAAKSRAREALSGGLPQVEARDGLWVVDMNGGGAASALESALGFWLRGVVAGGYIGIHAYLPRGDDLDASVRSLRAELGQLTRLATTFGYGPRFLHSTGQLHKGGPNRGLFIQLVDTPGDDLEIPEAGADFGSLISAQSLGDAEALFDRRQWVLRIGVGDDPSAAVDELTRRLAARRRG